MTKTIRTVSAFALLAVLGLTACGPAGDFTGTGGNGGGYRDSTSHTNDAGNPIKGDGEVMIGPDGQVIDDWDNADDGDVDTNPPIIYGHNDPVEPVRSAATNDAEVETETVAETPPAGFGNSDSETNGSGISPNRS
jgi:hypothetical protein